jgi:hypothetical protein
MKQMLLAIIVLVLTISACSHGSAAPKCDQAQKQQLTAAVDEATRELTTAEKALASYGGVVTVQNGDGFGMASSNRDKALRSAQLQVAQLGVFAEENSRCFTADERAELIAVARQINPG